MSVAVDVDVFSSHARPPLGASDCRQMKLEGWRDRLRAVLVEAEPSAPRSPVVFAHRQHAAAVLGRDLAAALAARSDKAIAALVGELLPVSAGRACWSACS